MPDRRPLRHCGLLLLTAVLAGCTANAKPAAHPPRHRARPSAASRGPRHPAARSADPAQVPAGTRPGGTLLARTIPGGSSRFVARRAWIWLPPVLRRRPRLRLPVLELLHGVPGGPPDWFTRGGARATLDAFAARHGGRAPIVVAPDINGTRRADTECVRTPYGADLERYLSVVVPAWVEAHYPVATTRRWAVTGISEGGTCSAMLALRNPSRYGLFGDFSGLARPTVGPTDDPATTIRVLFHGSRAAFDQHDPLWLMRHHRYPTLAGWVAYGVGDAKAQADAARMLAAGRDATLPMHEDAAPGRHDWATWTAGFARMLPWLWSSWR